MECLEIKKVLPLHLDQLMEESASQEIGAHLALCAECNAEKRRLEKFFTYSAHLPLTPPSTNVWRNIHTAIQKPTQPPAISLQWLTRLHEIVRKNMLGYAAGITTAIVVLLVLPIIPKVNTRPNVAEKTAVLLPSKDRPLVPESLQNNYAQFPVRQIQNEQQPAKHFYFQDGAFWEVDQVPSQPAVQYPVRQVGTLAAYNKGNF